MDTLAYLHLAVTYEASASPELLFLQKLNWTKLPSQTSLPLIFFAIAVTSLSLSSPSLALQKGDNSAQVTELQKKLLAAGYFDGPATGYYGSLTQAAVMKFQSSNGLTTDGIADPKTLKALESGVEAPTSFQDSASEQNITDVPKVSASPKQAFKQGVSSAEVTELQKKLQAAGYFDGPATGYYGSLTQAAVMKFQKAHGLDADGLADSHLLKALEFSAAAPTPSQSTDPQKGFTDDPQVSTSSESALKQGGSSAQVTDLQKKLQAAGYFDGPLTGYYGPMTQAAVTKFQKANGLTADGMADSKTLKALESSAAAPTPSQSTDPQKGFTTDDPHNGFTNEPQVSASPEPVLKKGDSSSQVTELQKKLQAAGYFDGPLTGYYGSVTQAAVTKFQKANGLTADGMADSKTFKALESSAAAPTPFPSSSPFIAQPKGENPSNLETPQSPSPSPQSPTTLQTPTPENGATDDSKVEKPGNNKPQKTSSSSQGKMTLKKTISGSISPKSVVYSGNGLFFAQNMMYSHTITVYDRKYNLVKTIPDSVDLSKYGYSKFKGKYQGAPVEASFSHGGKYAWVSNYQMYGSGFNNPGSDECSPSQKTDKSFLYRINTETLKIEKVIQVGSVPKYVATSPDNRLILVSNWCSWDLSVVDTEKNQEIKRIQLGRYPRGIVVDENSKKAYVAVMGSYDIATVNLDNFSVGWLKDIGHSPRHLNIDPEGKFLYATLNGEGKIAKIDLSSGIVLKKVVTGNAPRSMAISDDGQSLYVVNYNSNTVSKVRTSDMKVLQEVNVNSSPIGITYDPQTREVWIACYSGSILVFQD
jgi:YVTN family beta-propeller protein